MAKKRKWDLPKAVTATEAGPAPHPRWETSVIKDATTLELSNGQTVYGCNLCRSIFPRPGSVFAHQGRCPVRQELKAKAKAKERAKEEAKAATETVETPIETTVESTTVDTTTPAEPAPTVTVTDDTSGDEGVRELDEASSDIADAMVTIAAASVTVSQAHAALLEALKQAEAERDQWQSKYDSLRESIAGIVRVDE